MFVWKIFFGYIARCKSIIWEYALAFKEIQNSLFFSFKIQNIWENQMFSRVYTCPKTCNTRQNDFWRKVFSTEQKLFYETKRSNAMLQSFV